MPPTLSPPSAKALIVSILYQKWDGWELGGNHVTALELKKLLIEQYGYENDNIVMLLEDSSSSTQPTKQVIMDEMKRLVADAKSGDRFVFFFAGHGGQRDAETDLNETDGKDELLYPMDHDGGTTYIPDDDIREILVEPLKDQHVFLTGIFDCCHSGTIMDLHEFVYNKEDVDFQPFEVLSEPASPEGNITSGSRGPQRRSRKIPVRRGTLGLGANYVVSELAEHEEDLAKNSPDNNQDNRSPTIVEFPDRFVPTTLIESPSSSKENQAEHLDEPSEDRDVLVGQTFTNRGKPNTVVYQKSREPVPTPSAPDFAQPEQRDYHACITSWSACADHEQNWENKKGEAMGKPMIDYLLKNPRPTYRTLLFELTRSMHKNGLKRKQYWEASGRKDEVIFQRPQLGSLGKLDLDRELSL